MNHIKKAFSSSLVAAAIALGLAADARADVRLPNIYSDNMVLQRGMPVTIWGWADEGEQVTVTFRGEKLTTTAANGQWRVKLKKLQPGGPDTLLVAGKNNSLLLKNVLVGDVWLCGGQSNMEFPLQRSFEAKDDITSATNSQIRLLHVPHARMNTLTNNVDATWKECNPTDAAAFTAVGYYFGRILQQAHGVPIGVIESSWGGTPVEAWTKQEVYESNPVYRTDVIEQYSVNEKNHQTARAKFEKEEADAKATGAKFNKKAPGVPWHYSELYNGMIAPLTNYAITGAIWYQGEANAGRAEQYRSLFPDLIRNWREDWHEGNFPFLLVQLAPYLAIRDQPTESAWAELREAQLYSTQVLPKVGLAVITDVGNPDNIHPTQKKPVGERLALAARKIAYDENIVYSGPIYKSMKVKGDKIVLTFDNVGSGLEARDGELKGFAICGDDHKFFWAKAEIEGQGKHGKIVVSSSDVPHPVAVRYGWADCPVVNLWNKDGLPASPFRTDNFTRVTAGKK